MNDIRHIRPGSRQAWLLAARPRTLPVGLAPVLVGAALGWAAPQPFSPWAFLLAALAATAMQIASNLINDALDYDRGIDDESRLGPPRAAAMGLLRSADLKRATALLLAFAALLGTWLVYQGGWPILALGSLAILSALAYTAGPFPLGYIGLGEVFAFLFFGPGAVLGTAWLTGETLTATGALLSIGPGLLSANVLAVNNLRDEDIDRRKGKKTLPVRLGRRWALRLFVLAQGATFALPCALGLYQRAYALLLPLLALPLGVSIIRQLYRCTDRRNLNRTLAQSAMLMLLYALLLSAGIVASLPLPSGVSI
ncbi:MAG: 1,4-dihydroxy-2-naphthoate polyprenyltransferase [Myxococcales bacterium]|nr:1,4-dihydroxy-2-naphthoate polyprenyltransferase [Myxococcales bacterium]